MVREHADALRDGLRRRGALADAGPIVQRAESLDQERRALLQEVESRRAARNALSKEVGERKRQGADVADVFARIEELAGADSAADARLKVVQDELDAALLRIP